MPAPGPRTIVHLDLDAFYASVEQLDDPRLRGCPVIVGGTGRRGVVCAASYEARRFGVRSAMPTARARRLCPDGVYLPPRFDRYGALSDQVFGIYRRYTPLVEPLSLDEAFLDVTASRALHGAGADIARAIKAAVRNECGLAVSAGIADVKMAAKIATDLGKPDGLVEVPAGGVAAFLAPLPVGRLWGVGHVTEAALRKIGVATIGDLARMPEAALAAAIGASHARGLRALAMGDDPREVVPDEAAKSVGAEDTFGEDLVGRVALERELLSQAARVGRRLRAASLEGHVVTLKVKYADFELVTRRVTLPQPTDDDRAIYEAARAQLERIDLARPVRLTGISVSDFAGGEERGQLGLFAADVVPRPPEETRRRKLNAALDALADRFGENTVTRADLAGPARTLRRGGDRAPDDDD
ncbi:DNA polymerase IV [Anaeromyxobacter oryzae]|uniref:DNA polymerase IV n=1 Tax=Anaeromyxobacter oryzae TaxID=2918170 RepID=A0ABM7WVY9_9BACT|nr:DNA polymerase IV [Anaeromyxobacter oryzae]BDG03676.1 DNA polymerase IV [Anaeromyxobacter oryzae]